MGKIWKLIRSSWEVYGIYKAIAAYGLGAVMVGVVPWFLSAPLWVKVLLGIFVAVLWMLLVPGLLKMLSGLFKSQDKLPPDVGHDQIVASGPQSQAAHNEGGQTVQVQGDNIASGASPAVKTQGDYSPVTIYAQPPAPPQIHWLHRSGCPQFRMAPGLEAAKLSLLCQFYIYGAHPLPNTIEARWEGAGTNTVWMEPMPERPRPNEQLGFQMHAASMNPTPPRDNVRFHVRFYWDNQQHVATWVWPLVPHGTKATWQFDQTTGSGFGNPRAEDAQ